jgi:glycosyltransferase involved in cell wall biosynthesis
MRACSEPTTRVSVLINNYNYGRFLEYCLSSVARQTRPVDEIIIYDDGSTDESAAVLEPWRSKATVISQPNFGLAPGFNQANAINQAFSASTGDIICLLDADDAFLPRKVERVTSVFARAPETVMVQHPFAEIDATGRRTGIRRPLLKRVDPKNYIPRTHNFLNLFTQTSGLAFRREYLQKVLPLAPDELDTVWPDVRLSRQAIFHGGIHTLRAYQGEYRVHGKNDSDKLRDKRYLHRHRDQQYAFYNRIARIHGALEIDVAQCLTCSDQGINRPGLSLAKRVGLLARSREPAQEKARIIASWAGRQVKSIIAPRSQST